MKRQVTANDVLKDIEFELAQGAISCDDLGHSIQTVRQYHNKLRSETLPSIANGKDREAIGKVFQVNDMLITLLQEMAAAINRLQLNAQLVLRETYNPTDHILVDESESLHIADRLKEIENATSAKALAVDMDMQTSTPGILGTLVNRARATVHDLTLFYVHKLASKQTAVNQTLGDELRLVIAQVAELSQRIQELEQHQTESRSSDRGVDGIAQ